MSCALLTQERPDRVKFTVDFYPLPMNPGGGGGGGHTIPPPSLPPSSSYRFGRLWQRCPKKLRIFVLMSAHLLTTFSFILSASPQPAAATAHTATAELPGLAGSQGNIAAQRHVLQLVQGNPDIFRNVV